MGTEKEDIDSEILNHRGWSPQKMETTFSCYVKWPNGSLPAFVSCDPKSLLYPKKKSGKVWKEL